MGRIHHLLLRRYRRLVSVSGRTRPWTERRSSTKETSKVSPPPVKELLVGSTREANPQNPLPCWRCQGPGVGPGPIGGGPRNLYWTLGTPRYRGRDTRHLEGSAGGGDTRPTSLVVKSLRELLRRALLRTRRQGDVPGEHGRQECEEHVFLLQRKEVELEAE